MLFSVIGALGRAAPLALVLFVNFLCVQSIVFALVASLEESATRLKEDIHPMWLRERCLEPFYADPDTRQPKYNIHQEKVDIHIHSVDVAERDGMIGFNVVFSDGKACFFHRDRLEAELRNEQTFVQTDEWRVPEIVHWDKSLIAPPVFEHNDIVADSEAKRKFLSNLISIGIAVVNEVPRLEGECARFGQRISTARDTEWGRNFNVRSTPDTANGNLRKDLAYTTNAIGMHIDSPYRVDAPPSYQLLHAIDHCSGSECYVHNFFVDGLRVAADLCRTNREYFDVLASTALRWENNGGDGGSLLYRYAPMIELEAGNAAIGICPRVAAICFSAKSGGYAPNLPKQQLDLFYNAKRTFSSMLHDTKYTIKLQLYPGALVIFDNRRVLHSRSHIADTDGERWLQGCYLNRDGIHYQYERLRRLYKIMTETPFRNLREATKADYDRMGIEYNHHVAQKTSDNLMEILRGQKSAFLGAPVSLLEHGLQTASRALRAGEDDETIVISLFHDMFETLAVKNHGELVSSMLAPWISPRSQWILAHHEIFQGYYYFSYYGLDENRRDMFLGHPFYNWTLDWCEKYDQASFDSDYPTLDLSVFRPIVERVLSRTEYWWNPAHPKAGAVSGLEKSIHPGNATIVSKVECDETWTCYSKLDFDL